MIDGLTAYDRIEIECAVECVVGIYPEERVKTQPVTAVLTLFLDLETCGRTGDLAKTVDYAAMTRNVETILKDGKFKMLETAALAVLAFALAPIDGALRPVRARVALCKPKALWGAAKATVTLEREATHFPYINDVVFTCPDATVQRNGKFAEIIPN